MRGGFASWSGFSSNRGILLYSAVVGRIRNIFHEFPAVVLLWALTLLLFASGGAQDPPVELTGPLWSDALAFEGVEGITFRWRTDPGHRREGRNFFQFEFVDISSDSVQFSYLLETETGERIVGSITLGPGQSRFSGWYFEGSRIEHVEVVRPDVLKRMFDESAR